MRARIISLIVFVALFALPTAPCSANALGLKRDFTYKWGEGYVDVLRNNQVMARYIYKDASRPYVVSLCTPKGQLITANPATAGTAAQLLPFSVGFGDVNGVDFWSVGDKSGKIVETKLAFDPTSAGYWNIHANNEWIGPNGKTVCTEERRYSFLSCKYGTLIATMINLHALDKDLVLNDNSNGFLSIGLAPGFKIKEGKGHVINSRGKQRYRLPRKARPMVRILRRS